MLKPMEATLAVALLLKNTKELNPAIASHRKANRTLAAALLQSEFDRTQAVIEKIRTFTCTAHDWRTDSTGLIDTCNYCGEERA